MPVQDHFCEILDAIGFLLGSRDFYIGSVVVGLFFGLVGFISGQELWVTGLLLLVGGLGVPRWAVNFLRGRRQKKFPAQRGTAT